MEKDPRQWTAALRASHDYLVRLVTSLSTEQLERESYCSGWDVGQVLSHLGSGAEISLTGLERALGGQPPLDREEFPAIWARWNAMSPAEKVSQMVVWDRRHVSVLEGLDDATMATLRVPFIGMELDMASIVGLRLGEHSVHAWDVAVSFDPGAEILASSAELVIDRVGWVAGRTGKPAGASAPRRLAVHTSAPERDLRLEVRPPDGAVTLEEAGPAPTGPAAGTLELPAAALVRLVYGRLGRDHTPDGVRAAGEADLEELRRVFPGF